MLFLLLAALMASNVPGAEDGGSDPVAEAWRAFEGRVFKQPGLDGGR